MIKIGVCIGAWVVSLVAPAHAESESSLTDPKFVYSKVAVESSIAAAAETRKTRVEQAFRQASGEGLREAFCPMFADLWLGRNLDQTNALLLQVLTTGDPVKREKYRLNDPWCLAIDQQFYHMYYAFGSRGSVARGRLYPETEKALLEVLWERMKFKNDIHLARKSTWWMIGSENHDLVAKVSSLISSQIFMHEPAYKDRVFPDLGTGGGYTYWFHHMYGRDAAPGPEGRAHKAGGTKYTAEHHYREWVRFFHEYLQERARKGFFLEVASPGYMAVSVSYLTDLFDLCEDQELSRKAGKFLDLVWADWAQDQLNGVRGGAKTRVADGTRWADAMYSFARFYFGGAGSAQSHFFAQLLSSYEMKPIVWHLVLDRPGLGEFAYRSRRPGEEENIWPRPLGAERTWLCAAAGWSIWQPMM